MLKDVEKSTLYNFSSKLFQEIKKFFLLISIKIDWWLVIQYLLCPLLPDR